MITEKQLTEMHIPRGADIRVIHAPDFVNWTSDNCIYLGHDATHLMLQMRESIPLNTIRTVMKLEQIIDGDFLDAMEIPNGSLVRISHCDQFNRCCTETVKYIWHNEHVLKVFRPFEDAIPLYHLSSIRRVEGTAPTSTGEHND